MIGQSNPFSETQHTKNAMQIWRRRRSPAQSWVCTLAASVAYSSCRPMFFFIISFMFLFDFWSRLSDKIKIKKKKKKTNERSIKGGMKELFWIKLKRRTFRKLVVSRCVETMKNTNVEYCGVAFGCADVRSPSQFHRHDFSTDRPRHRGGLSQLQRPIL